MPRTRFDRFRAPPPDLLKGAILGAIRDQARSYDEMAAAVGVSRSTWCRMLNEQRADEWPLDKTCAACKYLGIPIDDLRSLIRY